MQDNGGVRHGWREVRIEGIREGWMQAGIRRELRSGNRQREGQRQRMDEWRVGWGGEKAPTVNGAVIAYSSSGTDGPWASYTQPQIQM